MSSDLRLRGSRLIRRPIQLLGSGVRAGSATKIFLLFFFAFLPLGVIALLGVLQAFRTMENERVARLQLSVEQRVNKLTRTIAEDRRTMLFLVDAFSHGGAAYCRRAEGILADRKAGRLVFAVFDRDGRRLCASSGDEARAIAAGSGAQRPVLDANDSAIDVKGQRLLLRIVKGDGSLVAIGAYSRDALVQIVGATDPFPARTERRVVLRSAGEQLILLGAQADPDPETIVAAAAPADLGLSMSESMRRPPTTLAALLVLLLPILLWLAAAALAWYSIHRLVLLPVVALQRAVATYHPGDDPAPIRRRSAMLDEIAVLGETFSTLARDVSSHEQQMLESLDRQRRLTREVHHRVKNNLQIITSLVSLHSRSAKSMDAAIAYASIQRRVEALAVVHRNHFAEIEQNDGIDGCALLSELASGLRGGAVDIGSGFALRVDCDQIKLDQDVAMPVAFLVTELVEMAARIDRDAIIRISLKRADPPPAGQPLGSLTVETAALQDSPALQEVKKQGFERVLSGLSRQLRSALLWDEATGRYEINVSIIG